jgi:hypothetical protein
MDATAPCPWCTWCRRFALEEGVPPYPDGPAFGMLGHNPAAAKHDQAFWLGLYELYAKCAGLCPNEVPDDALAMVTVEPPGYGGA